MSNNVRTTVVPVRAARWQDWANLILGVWLFISPWILRSSGIYNQDAWWVGALIVLVAIWGAGHARNRAGGVEQYLAGSRALYRAVGA